MGRSAVYVRPPLRPPGRGEEVRKFRDEALSGRIVLDNGRFERCRFKEAVLIYAGGASPHIRDCAFDNVTFEFQGAAGRTLSFLQAMAAPSSGLSDVFKASFPRVYGH